MNLSETPQITSCMYSSTTGTPVAIGELDMSQFQCANLGAGPFQRFQQYQQPSTEREKETMANDKTTRRIVQVFIADPNDNVPLDKSVLYTGDQKLTDLNDTELFFEVPINDLLKAHNEGRVKMLDREATKRAGKDVFLDPVKIRDLKMVVVTVASF